MIIPYKPIRKYKLSKKLAGQCLVINPLCLRPECRKVNYILVKVSYIEDDGTVWCNHLDPYVEGEFYGTFQMHYFIGTIEEKLALKLIENRRKEILLNGDDGRADVVEPSV